MRLNCIHNNFAFTENSGITPDMEEATKGQIYFDNQKCLYLVVTGITGRGLYFKSHEGRRLLRKSSTNLQLLNEGVPSVHDPFKVPVRRVINSLK